MDFLVLFKVNTSYFFKCWKLLKVFDRNCIKHFEAIFLVLYRTFQCFIHLICKWCNLRTNLLILSIYSIKTYMKNIVKDIIKKSIDKFRPTFRKIICISFGGHCTPVEEKNINHFWKYNDNSILIWIFRGITYEIIVIKKSNVYNKSSFPI